MNGNASVWDPFGRTKMGYPVIPGLCVDNKLRVTTEAEQPGSITAIPEIFIISLRLDLPEIPCEMLRANLVERICQYNPHAVSSLILEGNCIICKETICKTKRYS